MARGRWQAPELTARPGVPNFVSSAGVAPLGPDTIVLELATEEMECAEVNQYRHEHFERVEEISAIARNQLRGAQ